MRGLYGYTVLEHAQCTASAGLLTVNAFKQRAHEIKYKGTETHGCQHY
jgi:hypothetical protein